MRKRVRQSPISFCCNATAAAASSACGVNDNPARGAVPPADVNPKSVGTLCPSGNQDVAARCPCRRGTARRSLHLREAERSRGPCSVRWARPNALNTGHLRRRYDSASQVARRRVGLKNCHDRVHIRSRLTMTAVADAGARAILTGGLSDPPLVGAVIAGRGVSPARVNAEHIVGRLAGRGSRRARWRGCPPAGPRATSRYSRHGARSG